MDPKFRGTGLMFTYIRTGLCLEAQNGIYRDWVPIVLARCTGSERQQFLWSGKSIKLATNQTLCIDRQRYDRGSKFAQLNLENCSEHRTDWRFNSAKREVRGNARFNNLNLHYDICIFPLNNIYKAGVRMMAGPCRKPSKPMIHTPKPQPPFPPDPPDEENPESTGHNPTQSGNERIDQQNRSQCQFSRANFRSTKGGAANTIGFWNLTGGTVNIFWLDFFGNPKPYGHIVNRRSTVLKTYDGHYWVAKRKDGSCIGSPKIVKRGKNFVFLQ